MAEIVLTRIQFIANNTYGTFSAGDLVEVRMVEGSLVESTNIGAPISTGIKVYKDSGGGFSEITSGADIDPSFSVSRRFDIYPQICISTSLVNFTAKTAFPYVGYYTIPDAPSCAITPVTCNLIVLGTPTVVLPTSETSADGSITVVGQSSYPIQYGLSDFLYGNGQASGVFTGLAYGTYRIFLRDSQNCSASIVVTLTYNPSYGPKLRMEYDDMAGNVTKVELCEKDYASTVTEVCGGDTPVLISLRGEGETDKFIPVLSTQLEMSLSCETADEFSFMYTSDPSRYLVKYYKNNTLYWTGKLLPFSYQELYKAPPYEVSTIATDGIAELKDFAFIQADGSQFEGTMKLIKIIAYCLQQTKLLLNIRVGCNLYADGMNTTASDDPLDQAYADVEAIYLSGQVDCLSVIKNVLRPFGAQLRQWNNVWNIVRTEELGAQYDYREFDSNGDYVSNSSFNGSLDIVYPNAVGDVVFDAFPNREMKNGYGQITVRYKLGVKKNMLGNGDFRLINSLVDGVYTPSIDKQGWTLVNDTGYTLIEGYEAISNDNVALTLKDASVTDYTRLGRAYLISDVYNVKMGINNTLKITIRAKVEIPQLQSVRQGGITFPYVKLRVRVKYGTLYLRADGTWSSTVNTISFFIEEYNKYIDNEIIAKYPSSGTPTAGMDLVVTLYHAHAYNAEGGSVADIGDIVTVGLPVKVRTEYNDGTRIRYYELEEIDEAQSLPDIINPDDYDVDTNMVKWVLKGQRDIVSDQLTFYVDKIVMNFLNDGEDVVGEIVKTAVGELRNLLTFSDDLFFGSKPDVISTEISASQDSLIATINQATGLPYSWRPPPNSPESVNYITNMPSYDLVYAGWLRDADGDAWDYWTRDGVAESEKLHGIFLKMFVGQYKSSWTLMRARLNARTSGALIGMMSSFVDTNGGNKVYIPVSGTLDDLNCTFDGELLETVVVGVNGSTGDSDGSGTSPYSAEFTNEFAGDFSG